MKIIDCFLFYNELDLLNYRFNLLKDVCDYFVLVESKYTFVGKEKKLYYEENKELFKDFHSKIIHIVIDKFPFMTNITPEQVWKNENFQRNQISLGISKIPNLKDDDIIIISDLDEIANPNTLQNIKKYERRLDIQCLEMDMYYYNLNNLHKDKWYHGKILSYIIYKKIKLSCNDIRYYKCSHIPNGGWHLSYFGDEKFIQNKLINFSHQEYNSSYFLDTDRILNKMKSSEDLFERNNVEMKYLKLEQNNNLPPMYEKYLQKFY